MDKRLLNQLYRYAISLTGDADEAYDLLQQAVERFLRQKKNSIRSPTGYLMQIIRHLFFDRSRRQQLHLIVSQQLQHDAREYEDTLSLTDILIYKEDVEQLMSQLDHHERELLYLWAVEEYTAQEIAEMRSLSRGTVLSQLHRLKKKLRANVQPRVRSAQYEK